MARICLAPSPQPTGKNLVSRRPGTKRGEPCAPAQESLCLCSLSSQLSGLRASATSFSSGEETVAVSDLCLLLLPAPRRCVMSAGAAQRLRWQRRAAWSLLLFFFLVVVVVLPLLVFMAQGGQQAPAHVDVGEDRQIDGGGHAEQQLSRLGSRPPCCDRKCGACAPCTAVQVRAGAAAAREPGLRPLCANYEPVGWKCRCGAAIFDP